MVRDVQLIDHHNHVIGGFAPNEPLDNPDIPLHMNIIRRIDHQKDEIGKVYLLSSTPYPLRFNNIIG